MLLCTFVQALDPSLTVNATTDSLLTADPCEDFSDELVLGCTDAAADNFDADATVSDGSCRRRGCTDSAAVNFNSRATDDDGSCALPRAGCVQPAADNYDPLAVSDDSCEYAVRGCTARRRGMRCCRGGRRRLVPSCRVHRHATLNFDSTATAGDGGCVLPARGCTDSAAPNYAAAANVNDGSCARGGCTDPTALNFAAVACGDGNWEARRPGCVEPAAVNTCRRRTTTTAAGCAAASTRAPQLRERRGGGRRLVRVSCARLHRPEGRLPVGRHRRRRQLRPSRLHAHGFNYDAAAHFDDGSCAASPPAAPPPTVPPPSRPAPSLPAHAAAAGAAAASAAAVAVARHRRRCRRRAGALHAGAAAGAACDAAGSPPSPPAAPCPSAGSTTCASACARASAPRCA